MEITQGQIWRIKKAVRPDVEIVRFDTYSQTVYWRYVDSNTIYENGTFQFLSDFEPKAS
jgi:hypothetical protein